MRLGKIPSSKPNSTVMEEEQEDLNAKLEEYLNSHPEFVSKWLRENPLQHEGGDRNHIGGNLKEKTFPSSNETTTESHPTPTPTHQNLDEDVRGVTWTRSRSRSKRNSISSDKFQSWLSTSSTFPPSSVGNNNGESVTEEQPSSGRNPTPTKSSRIYKLQHLDENELFIELVK